MQKKITLANEFDRIWKRVVDGDNFALVRNGDGERGLMEGRAFHAQEGWSSSDGKSKLGEALIDSISYDDPRYIIGISCPCCDIDAYSWYIEHIKSQNITFANLWVNSNYTKFVERFRSLKRDAIVIANHRAKDKPIGCLNVLNYYCVSDDCVSFWEQEAEQLIQRILNEYGERNNLLYVVSAGPMSGPIIARLFSNNPNNCYLDFGSAIDSFYWEKVTRPYMKSGSVYAQQKCWMYDPNQDKAQVQHKNKLLKKKKIWKQKRKAFLEGIPTLPQRIARKIFGNDLIETIKRKIKG